MAGAEYCITRLLLVVNPGLNKAPAAGFQNVQNLILRENLLYFQLEVLKNLRCCVLLSLCPCTLDPRIRYDWWGWRIQADPLVPGLSVVPRSTRVVVRTTPDWHPYKNV